MEKSIQHRKTVDADSGSGCGSEVESFEYDFVVIGGGLAGICAAIAAARRGVKTAIIQDRPVLGGNSSSEVRVQPSSPALRIPWAVETGIIQELLLEDRWRNHVRPQGARINSIWDLVLYDMVSREPCLDLFLNTTVRQLTRNEDGTIASIRGVQLHSERSFEFHAPLYCDATGDGTVGYQAGATFRYGREAQSEFGEPGAPEQSDSNVMPSSLLMQARDTGHPVPFRAPEWVVKYPDEKVLFRRAHYDPANDEYLWLEVGSPFDTITDNEPIRDEILKHALGVWDHVKNHCTHKEQAANWALEWVGSVVGKRESRRIEGDYLLREQDVRGAARFDDSVAYGGWYVDTHNYRGLKADVNEAWIASDLRQVMVHPYAIPYRCLYSKDVANLFLAGRCMSVTHMALGSVRLQPTLAICGQAVGTAVALCLERDVKPRELGSGHIRDLQQELLRDGCFLPGIDVDDPADRVCHAELQSSSEAALVLQPSDTEHPLDVGLGQMIPVSGSRIDTVWANLFSRCSEPTTLRMGLRAADNCWDFGQLKDIAEATAEIPPFMNIEVPFHLNAEVEPHRYYWVYIESKPGVVWKEAREIPIGVVGAWEVDFQPAYYYHAKKRVAYAIRLVPDSHPYGPGNIKASPARPERWTNCWVSDPKQPLPQALTLKWSDEQTFDTIQITFDSDLNREYRYRPPLSVPPQIVRDYDLEVLHGDEWTTVLEERDNRLYRREHALPAMRAKGLRLVVRATHGDPCARIYGIRVHDRERGAPYPPVAQRVVVGQERLWRPKASAEPRVPGERRQYDL